jgi:hypothetical protein
MADESQEIKEARALLALFEMEPVVERRLRFFREAFEILHDFLKEEPPRQEWERAHNLQNIYARKLVEALPAAPTEFAEWAPHFALLALHRGVLRPLLAADAALADKHQRFVEEWKDEVLRTIKKGEGS